MSPYRLNLLDRAFVQDPYPIFRLLRRRYPIGKVDPLNYWYISRYDDAAYVLSQPKRFSSKIMNCPDMFFDEVKPYFAAKNILGLDPPEHGPLRRIIHRAFGLKQIQSIQGTVDAICAQLLSGVRAEVPFNFMETISMVLPVEVISRILGVDPTMREEFKRWSDDVLAARVVKDLPDGKEKQQRMAEIAESFSEFDRYFTYLLEERRQHPRQDLLTDLVQAGSRLELADILSMSRLVLGAGTETTTSLLNNCMRILAVCPSVYARVSADPALLPQFIEEVLRYDSPALGLFRTATEDVELGGQTIRAGDHLYVMVASAHRDEDHYLDPDIFNLDREESAHMGFGLGIHGCVGGLLARCEAKTAFLRMIEEQGQPQIVGPLEYEHSYLVRGLKRLTMRFGAQATPSRSVASERLF